MKYISHKSRGFTLIEILITTIIIVVFSATSLAGYRYFNEQRKLELATKQFVEVLELLKKNAISGYKPVGMGSGWAGNFKICIFTEVFGNIYQFGFDGGLYCALGPLSPYSGDATVILNKTDTYNNIVIYSINNSTISIGAFVFKAFGSGIRVADNTSPPWYAPLDANGGFSVTFKNTAINKTKTVQVDRAGTITIQ